MKGFSHFQEAIADLYGSTKIIMSLESGKQFYIWDRAFGRWWFFNLSQGLLQSAWWTIFRFEKDVDLSTLVHLSFMLVKGSPISISLYHGFNKSFTIYKWQKCDSHPCEPLAIDIYVEICGIKIYDLGIWWGEQVPVTKGQGMRWLLRKNSQKLLKGRSWLT